MNLSSNKDPALAIDSTGAAYVSASISNYGSYPTTSGAYKTSSNEGGYIVAVSKLNAAGSGLAYSTLLGLGWVSGIAADPQSGAVYVTGSASAATFPTTPGAYKTAYPSSTAGTYGTAFVTAVNAAGSGLLYSTFIGGTGSEYLYGPGTTHIAFDSLAQPVVTGITLGKAQDPFLTTAGAYVSANLGASDVFVTIFQRDLSQAVFASIVGGTSRDSPTALAVDSSGIYVAGTTDSRDFPVTSSAWKQAADNGFVFKLNAGGSGLVYATYYPLYSYCASCSPQISADASGRLIIGVILNAGTDLPATGNALQKKPKGSANLHFGILDPTGSNLEYSSYLGGSLLDQLVGLATDAAGDMYFAGFTTSPDFPLASPVQSTFSQVQYMTYTHGVFGKITRDNTACFTAVDRTIVSVGSEASTQTIRLTAPPGCPWTAGPIPAYLYDSGLSVSPASGIGSATITVKVSANFSATPRSLAVTAGEQQISVLQSSAPCTPALLPATGAAFPGGGGVGNISVSIPQGCTWNLSSNSSWLVPMTGSGSSGGSTQSAYGSGNVVYVVTANNGAARTGTVFVNSMPFVVTQSAGTIQLSRTSFAFDKNANTASFSIVSNTAGPWTAMSQDSWVKITSGPSGSGTGTVTFTVDANATGAQRMSSIVVSGAVVAVVQRQTSALFSDVSESDYFFDSASLLRERGITAGCSEAPLQFCPNAGVTQGQLAIFIVRAVLGGDTFPYPATPAFNDVPATHPYFRWIQKLSELGIASGCGTSNFCPDAPVTRREAAVLLMKARLSGIGPPYSFGSGFTDLPNDSSVPYITAMAQQSITTGCSPTLFCPNDTLTRGQVSLLLVRALFNLLLPGNAPMITSVTPNVLTRGQTVSVTVTEANSLLSQFNFNAGPDVSFGLPTATTATSMTLPVTVSTSAKTGPRTLASSSLFNSTTAYGPNLLVIQ